MAGTEDKLRTGMSRTTATQTAPHDLAQQALARGKRLRAQHRTALGVGVSALMAGAVLTATSLSTSAPSLQASQTVTSETSPGHSGAATFTSRWGLRPVSSPHPNPSLSVVTALRVERSGEYDQLTIFFSGSLPDYRVQYVARFTPPESDILDLRGGATLQLQLGASTRDNEGNLLFKGDTRASYAYPAIKETALSDYEGTVTVGVGVQAHAAFRVAETTAPLSLTVLIHH